MGVDGIEIHLERSSGVYYPGEVVRGTAVLRTSGLVKCRCFLIHLEGRSRVEWKEGSGDSEREYEGHTSFVHQRHTLVGNYHKTGVLHNAGRNAVFGQAHGDGTYFIGCDDCERSDLNLVVRVMDHEFFKRDDLCGEILLDVADLAKTKSKRSYPLTQNGRPEKGEVTLSAKFVPSSAIFPSSVGHKHPLCLILHVHKATGLRQANWTGRNEVYVQVYRAPAGVSAAPAGKALPPPQLQTCLPQGRTVFPFAFALPTALPGSAEVRHSYRVRLAYVRYCLYAHVDFAGWRNPSRRRTITVLPNRPVPTLRLLAPVQRGTGDVPIYGCAMCSCRMKGLVNLKLAVPRQAYACGESIDLSKSVASNQTGMAMTLKVLLKQHVTLRCPSHQSGTTLTFYHHHETITHNLLQQRVPPNGTVGVAPVQLPPVFPSFNGGIRTFTRTRYAALQWSYGLELRVDFDDIWSTDVCTEIPILVSCAPPFPEAIEAAKAEKPSQNPFYALSLFNGAVNYASPCSTTPHLVGQEFGGNAAVPQGFNSGVSTYHKHEDCAAIGGSNPVFHPKVNVFAPPEAPRPSHNDKCSPKATSDQTNGSDSCDIGPLLSAMKDSLGDQRRVVGNWIHENPHSASRLTPAQVGQIMKLVSFSLEQPSVAGDLVAGFEPTDTLSCKHVVAAMQASEYQKSEIAQAMAPYVCDPQNKAEVLNAIEYSYDREAIAKYFQ